ncbi:MAG: ABC transporter permease [Chloracidobacterium sp.]|nr:ABC transporter permease [Chloracidobacterium sp.]
MIDYFRALAARLRGLFGDRGADQELNDEIETHLRLLAERYVRQGMNEDKAALAARRQFGNVTLLKETNHEMRGFRFIETLVQDLKYGLRMLRRNPGFTVVAVLTLALGIGANTAIFSVVNAVLLRPLPYTAPDRLVTDGHTILSPTFLNWRAQSQSFEQMAAYTTGTSDLTGGGEPERLTAGLVSAELFSTLGVPPSLGRGFTAAEDQPNGALAVILSHWLWQRRFGGDPQLIGRAITLDGQNRTVVGVMPSGFQFPAELDLWLPLNLDTSGSRKGMVFVNMVGRLKPGVTMEAARTDLTTILRRVSRPAPNDNSDVQVRVIKLHERLVGDWQQALLVIFGAVAFVLLIACVNVANLLLARASTRQKEMAIRAAVGAGRPRLVRQLLAESLLLSLAGGGAGLLVAILGVKLLVRMNPEGVARLQESSVDGRALGFTSLIVVLTGLLAGVFPALQASKADVNETLKAQSAVRPSDRGASRTLPSLMVAEIALALVLAVGAGLMIKSFMRLLSVPKGFNPEGILTLVLSPSRATYPPGSPRLRSYYEEALASVKTMPGVQSASLSSFLPLAGRTFRKMGFQIEGREPIEGSFEVNCISPGYFGTMGLMIRSGRPITDQDGSGAPPVTVINETFARRFFPGENPIGRRLLFGPNPNTIVGVAGDTRQFGLDQEVEPEIYTSYLQGGSNAMRLVVRAAYTQSGGAGLASLAATIRNQIQALEPNEPVNQVITMDRRLADSVAQRRYQTLVFGVFASVALIIATVGIYGVISYGVGQRKHEIGIRMALGAQSGDVLRMVVGQGMRLTMTGATLGVAAALGLTRALKSLLFDISATDPVTFVSVTLLLVIVALIASYIPARRATKVDPVLALRHD